MKHTHRRLKSLESEEAQRRAEQERAGDPLERLNARLDAIAHRLRANGIVIDIDAAGMAQRIAVVRAYLQNGDPRLDAWHL
jgi:hypothetical protein